MRKPLVLTKIPILAFLLCACAVPRPAPKSAVERQVVEERFLTPRDERDNVDSPAVWHGPGGQHWLLATAKSTDVILVYDAASGAFLRRFGGTGTGPGAFRRPNSAGVVGDLLLVVERDNRRVQVFQLPELRHLGFIGEETLRRPYGMTAFRVAGDTCALYVTDNYETADGAVPPDSALGERVRQYRFGVRGGALWSEELGAFGDRGGPGALRKVESLWADPAQGRLLVADELGLEVKVYTLAGRFTGEILGRGVIRSEPEGIALYTCGAEEGYWIATDQDYQRNLFCVFDRKTLTLLGAFSGRLTRNTDGVALTQAPFGPFAQGAFFAVHDDGNVAAFAWEDIARPLGLRHDCAASP
jgi:3-phytase